MASVSPDQDDTPKRRQIIQGAAQIFSDDGYEGASMSRIAEQANVSKGTLYNYFASKSDLFVAYVQHETAERIAWVVESAEGEGSIEDTLRAIARRLIHVLASPMARTMHRILISEAPKFPGLARAYYEATSGRGLAEMKRLLDREVGRGRLRIDDTALASEQFVALCRTRLWMQHCLYLSKSLDETEIERLVEGNTRLFLRSYGAGTTDA